MLAWDKRLSPLAQRTLLKWLLGTCCKWIALRTDQCTEWPCSHHHHHHHHRDKRSVTASCWLATTLVSTPFGGSCSRPGTRTRGSQIRSVRHRNERMKWPFIKHSMLGDPCFADTPCAPMMNATCHLPYCSLNVSPACIPPTSPIWRTTLQRRASGGGWTTWHMT